MPANPHGLTSPCIVYLCGKCAQTARFTDFDYAPIGANRPEEMTAWDYLKPDVFVRLLKGRGWIVDEDGYTFCSVECQSKTEIDLEYSTRRAMNMLRGKFPQIFGKQ